MKGFIRNLLREGVVNIDAKNLLDWFNGKRDSTFVFFDTETTGFKRELGDQLTQIGAIACYFNPETLRFAEIDKFNEMVRLGDEMMGKVDSEKDLELPDDAEGLGNYMRKGSKRAVLKYNHYDIAKSGTYMSEEEALGSFKAFLDNQDNIVLLAHNAPFDLSFVEFKNILGIGDIEVFDTLYFFKNSFYPILKRIQDVDKGGKELYDRLPINPKGYKSSSLPDLVKGFTVDPNELYNKLNKAHDAVQDCRNTIEVFELGIKAVRSYLKIEL